MLKYQTMLSDKFIEEYKFNNKSGKMSSEKYVLNNFKNDYKYIIDGYSLIDELTFKEKVYLCYSNINSIVLCKNDFCEKKVKFKNSKIGYLNYCSNRCVGLDPKIKKKKEDSNILKYGDKHASMNKDIKKKNNQKKYQNRTKVEKQKIKDKRLNTVKEKYGVDNVNQVDEIINKRIESFKMNIESWNKSYKKTSLERYGYHHPWSNKEIHKKGTIKTKISKENSLYESVLLKIDNINIDLIDINYENRKIKFKCNDCQSEFKIHREHLQIRHKQETIICTNCNPLKKHISGQEVSLFNFINEIYNDEIIRSDRKLLNGKELDIYLPDINLAFEFNGLYWHSELNKDKITI